MSAQLTTTTCTYCKGSGIAEKLVERSFNGELVDNTMLDHSLADSWIASDRMAPIKWVDCACPVCDGIGEYMIELTPCKIF